MDARQLRELIVQPTLVFLSPEIPYSQVAEELLMLTAAVESDCGQFIQQTGGGPALGIYQMEPGTYRSLMQSLRKNPKWGDIAFKIDCLFPTWPPENSTGIAGNLFLATAMARLKYYEAKDPLPKYATDTDLIAKYWKKHYNSLEGKGTVKKAVDKYRKYVRWTGGHVI